VLQEGQHLLHDAKKILFENQFIEPHPSENQEKNNEKCSAAISFNMGFVSVKIGATREGQHLLQDAKKILFENQFIKPELLFSLLNTLGCICYKEGKYSSAFHLFHIAHQEAKMELQKRRQEKKRVQLLTSMHGYSL